MAENHLLLDSFIPYRLSVVTNLVSESVAHLYRSLFRLSIPEWRVIAVVAETEGLTQQAIGQRTRMDKVSVSRAAIRLEKRGLVERRPSLQDGRSQQLRLTDAGLDLYENIAPKAKQLERQIFGKLSNDEIMTLMSLLEKIEAATLRRIEEDQPSTQASA
jgi:DNA-binding MarR family transcriptional regulator